jgi:hypothetical protein
VKKALDRMGSVATDIEPVFVTADSLAPAAGSARAKKAAKGR